MNLIHIFNRFIFTRLFNPFDILCIFIITTLLAESIWALALYIPTMTFSSYMQMKVEKNAGN